MNITIIIIGVGLALGLLLARRSVTAAGAGSCCSPVKGESGQLGKPQNFAGGCSCKTRPGSGCSCGPDCRC